MIKMKNLIKENSSWSYSDKKQFEKKLASELESAFQSTVEEWKKIIKQSVMELIGINFSEIHLPARNEPTAESPIKKIESAYFYCSPTSGISSGIIFSCVLENGVKATGDFPLKFDQTSPRGDVAPSKVKVI